jgi:hypothetical protein
MHFLIDSTADLLMWAAAETAIIIIGASIPFLRKLLWQVFRPPKSINGYAKSSAQHWDSRNDGATVRLGNITNAYKVQAHISDDGSEKSILSVENGTANGIMVSRQFTARVDSDDSKASSPRPGR